MTTTSHVVSGTMEVAAISRTAASTASSVARSTARMSTWMAHDSVTTLGRVPPRITPALTVTLGQRPLSAWSAMTLWAASSSAAATLLGLHAGVRRTSGDAQLHVQDALAGADEVAVGARTLEHERRVRVLRPASG